MAFTPSLQSMNALDAQQAPASGFMPTADKMNALDSQQNQDVQKTLSLSQASPWGLEMNMAASSPVQTNIANNLAQGATNTAASPVNLGIRGINAALGKNIPLVDPTIQGIKTDPGMVKAMTALTSAIPFVATDGLINPMESYAAKAALRTGSGAAQGLLGAANNPTASLGRNALLGGFLGLGGAALSNAVPDYLAAKGVAAGTGASDLNTPQAAGNIATAAQAAGISPDIGSVIGAKGSSNIYNDILGTVPFSGVETQQKTIISKIQDMANNIMNGLKGSPAPGDVGDAVKDAVATNMGQATATNKQMFANVFKQAGDQGFNISSGEFPNTAATAARLLDENQSALGIAPTLPEKFESKLQNLIKNNTQPDAVADNHIVDLGGSMPTQDVDSALNKSDVTASSDPATANMANPNNDGKTYSLNSQHTEISNIGDLARQAALTGDMKTASFYTSIKNAMNQDMNNKMASIPGLSDGYAAAKADFAQNVVPYRQQQILNIVNGKSDANALPSLLTKTQNQKVFQDLPQQSQNQVIYHHLKNSAEMQTDAKLGYSPAGVVSSYKNMQKSVPSYVMNDGAQSQLDNLSRLGDIYKTANANVNAPYTGFRAFKNWGPVAGVAGIGALAHMIGMDVPESIGAAAVAPIAARIAGKALRSNYLLNNYINASNKTPPSYLRTPIQSLLLNQGQGGSS